MTRTGPEPTPTREVLIPSGTVQLPGTLAGHERSAGIVIFAHGSGSGRFSPRNQFVARALQEAHVATLLFDLLTPTEQKADELTAHLRFDIELLAERLLSAVDWVAQQPIASQARLGLYGASTGAAAALKAAARRAGVVQAVVSRGGRPDLAESELEHVKAATLLLVGSKDAGVLDLNERAAKRLRAAPCHVEVIAGAGHLFEEPGKLEQVAEQTRNFFRKHLLA